MKNYPFITLVFVSILCGVLWRLEIEYQGWAGLIWLNYFHLSIPTGFLLFLIWANYFIDTRMTKRILMNLVAVFYGVGLYYIIDISLSYRFARGPLGTLMLFQTAEWLYSLLAFSIYIIASLMPVILFLILRMFGFRIKWKYLLIAVVCMLISIPLSEFLLVIINHKGGHNFIHSIKSGVLIPMWVFTMGLIIIGANNELKQTKRDLDPNVSF